MNTYGSRYFDDHAAYLADITDDEADILWTDYLELKTHQAS